MLISNIDRGIFEPIRLKLVELNLLPNILSYGNTSAYEEAKINLRNSRTDKTLVDLFGVGSPESRGEKTDSKIVIDRKGVSPNIHVGAYPETKIEKKGSSPETYKKIILPESCYDIDYAINIICTNTKSDRLLHDIVFSSIGAKRYLNCIQDDGSSSTETFLILYTGIIDITKGNFIERILRYRVDQVWITEGTLVRDNIPQLKKVDSNIKLAPKDGSTGKVVDSGGQGTTGGTPDEGTKVSHEEKKPHRSLTDFRSEFAEDGFTYVGYILNSSPVIKRKKGDIEQVASGLTELTKDWNNRLNLSYS